MEGRSGGVEAEDQDIPSVGAVGNERCAERRHVGGQWVVVDAQDRRLVQCERECLTEECRRGVKAQEEALVGGLRWKRRHGKCLVDDEGRRQREDREGVCRTCTVFCETDALMAAKIRLRTGLLSSSVSYVARAYASVRWARFACVRGRELEVGCMAVV
jgi:hypothetical protein